MKLYEKFKKFWFHFFIVVAKNLREHMKQDYKCNETLLQYCSKIWRPDAWHSLVDECVFLTAYFMTHI